MVACDAPFPLPTPRVDTRLSWCGEHLIPEHRNWCSYQSTFYKRTDRRLSRLSSYGKNVTASCSLRIVAALEFFQHSPTKLGHRDLLSVTHEANATTPLRLSH